MTRTQRSAGGLPSPAAEREPGAPFDAEWSAGTAMIPVFLARDRPYVARSGRYTMTGWYRRVDYTSMIMVKSGTGALGRARSIGERPIFHPLTPGKVFLLRPHDATLIRADDPGEVRLSYVSFPTASWRSFVMLSGLDPLWETAEDPPSCDASGADSGLRVAFSRVIKRFASGSATRYDLLQFWMTVAPQFIPFAEENDRLPGDVPQWLVDGLAAMHDEANLQGGVPRLSELAHVSSSYLAVCTRRYYGRTPTELVAELRLQRATELLRVTDAGIGDIAARCGFSSLVYFSGRFRAAHGTSPRDYRQSLVSYVDPSEFEPGRPTPVVLRRAL